MDNSESKYLNKLELLNDTGYFTGLDPESFYNVLKDNYETSNSREREFMDENADLYMDRYKNGIVQTNLIYKRINSIYWIMVFFVILMIASLIYTYYIYTEYIQTMETLLK